MRNIILCIFIFLCSIGAKAQLFSVGGKVTDSQKVLPRVLVKVEGKSLETYTNSNGEFSFKLEKGSYNLVFSYRNITKIFPTKVVNDTELLVVLSADEMQLSLSNEIVLTDEEVGDEEGSADMVSGLLQSSRDVYFQRASFDFNQVFFRPRGYDSKESSVLINGIPMAKVDNGRVRWSNWGGLNDMTRNQVSVIGIGASEHDFGGLLGSNYISVRPSENRAGFRLSATAANRTYSGRTMATYNSGMTANSLAYSISASKRWANDGGYNDGTPYDAYAVSGALEYKPSRYYSMNLVGIYSFNNYGKSAPLTQEAIALGGRGYNPNWGYLNGRVRNSKMKRIAEPIFIFSQTYEKNDTKISANIGYQFGQQGDTRIQYAKAQNPDPTYYTNMPSYYFAQHNPDDTFWQKWVTNDKVAKQIKLFDRQLDWNKIYLANKNIGGESLYALNEDVIDTKTLTANVLASTKITPNIFFNAGVTYQKTQTENFQQVNDLLGGTYFANKNYFSGQWYNTANENLGVGGKYQYHYLADVQNINGFGQLRFQYGRADFYVAGKYDYTAFQREGMFENNAVYPDSKGKSHLVQQISFATKGGLTYSLTGRHILQFNTGFIQTPQLLNSVFLNIRNSNLLIPFKLKPEEQLTADASYIIRTPYFKSRLTAYATEYTNAIEKNFFFTQARVGEETAGFISESLVGVQKWHYGAEFGAEVQILPTLKATAVATLNKYLYANNPIIFQSSDHELLSTPRTAYLKNYKVAAGPQQAFSAGLEYRSPRYWWVGATANWFFQNYVDVAPSLRTQNIYINPETGSQFTEIDPNKVREFLTQEDIGRVFLVNLTAGKSWKIKNKYLSVFASVNNLFDTQFKSGGFEQARTGHYQALLKDRQNGYPNFGNKYFTGYGATYYLNIAFSF